MDSYFGTKPRKSLSWLSAAFIGLAVCGVGIVAALWSAFAGARQLVVGAVTQAALGPISILSIEKTANSGGGYSLALRPQMGLIVLLAVCLATTLGLAWLLRHQRPSQSA